MTTLLIIYSLLAVPLALIGGTVILLIAKPKDGWTNRISHLRLVWLALSKPSDDVFKGIEWLRRDVHENIG